MNKASTDSNRASKIPTTDCNLEGCYSVAGRMPRVCFHLYTVPPVGLFEC